ncbi:MAG: hypothetical protein IOC92_08995, partial [Rhodobacter sp.]|nr:hypothetical protein [Rhodobacter sp.]MCA3478227.1 hypothetical protein [Rhodobacter sp.]MCA3484040.1 hypothetical protein [Rhodobacter sp.]MCA3490850.1 hypothetical protein [Rhodobacter sp.]
MTPFRIGDGAPVVRKFGETLQITAHGQDTPRSRTRPGLAVAKPHVTAPLPTRWQASSFPAVLQGLIKVAHEGIDTARIRPDPAASVTLQASGRVLRPGDEVLTFVNRNLEPYRGFHIFMRALPAVLRARPQARVVIVGAEGVSYGGPPPGGGSWKQALLAEVGAQLDLARVHFVGQVPHNIFVALMQ